MLYALQFCSISLSDPSMCEELFPLHRYLSLARQMDDSIHICTEREGVDLKEKGGGG